MINVLDLSEKNFPALLKEIPGAPEKIYFRGVLDPLNNPCIAIVGTRKLTDHGKSIAKKFAKSLVDRGFTIVSGLALGIDSAAHEGALEAGGKTVAVLATGMDTVYPSQNKGLAEKILENGGALISEYPENTPSYPSQFLERNRIVSGLSLATIVIEAPIGSGAISTAHHAVEQNREVFVVPGPHNHPNYIGSHLLIREGARLASRVEEILDDLNMNPENSEAPATGNLFATNGLDEKQKEIISVLHRVGAPVNIDKISELLKIDVSDIIRQLTFLILKGLIKEEGGRYYLN